MAQTAARGDASSIREFRHIFAQMLHGKKPDLTVDRLLRIGTSEDDKGEKVGPEHSIAQRTIRMLEHMYEDNYLTDFPAAYAHIKIANGTVPYGFTVHSGGTVAERVTKYHPLSLDVIQSVHDLRTTLDDAGYGNVYVVGQDTANRFGGKPADLSRYNAFVVPPCGDIALAEEFLRVLEAKAGGKRGYAHKPIIIAGSGGAGFWRPLTAGLGEPLLSTCPDSNGDLLRKLKSADVARGNAAQEMTPPLTIEPDSTLLVATKTAEKIKEIQARFAGTNIKVISLDLVANFPNVDEKNRTFAGNVVEKLEAGEHALHQQIAQMGEKHFREAIRSRGGDPDKLYIIAEDSGLHLKEGRVLERLGLDKLGLQPGFEISGKHFPGVEFGPVMNSMLGEGKFWEAVNRAFDDIDRETPDHKARRDEISTSVMAIKKVPLKAPLHAGVSTDHRPVIFSAEIANNVARTPQPLGTAYPNTSHYEVPCNQNPVMTQNALAGGQLSRAEIVQTNPKHWLNISPRGMAAEAMMRACGVYEIGSDVIHPKFMASQEASLASQIRVATLGDKKLAEGFASQYLAHERISMKGLADTSEGETQAKWNEKFRKIGRDADAFIVLPDHEQKPEHMFDRIFTFFSAMVAHQVHPRDKNKPLIVVNENGCWDSMVDLYDKLRETMMCFDQQRLLIQEVDSIEEAQAALLEHSKDYFKSFYQEDKPHDIHIKDSGRFNVAVFCSATAKNRQLNEDSEKLGEFLGKQNFGLIYGAGDREMMGSVYRGMRNVRDAEEGKGWIGGSSVKHLLGVENANPQKLTGSLNDYYDAATIYDRMEYMVNAADAFAVIPGGVGTIQELALILMLKQAHHPSMEGKRIVVLDQMKIGEQDVQFYEPIRKMMSDAQWKDLGVEFCQSMPEVQEKLDAIRTETLSQKGTPETAILTGQYMQHEYGQYSHAANTARI